MTGDPAMNHRPIFFLTDFGDADPFAGLMKARALSEGHRGPLVDLTHAIAPQDVRGAAVVLEDCLPWLPADAVVCAVVDPSVGSSRRALAVEAAGRTFVAPDNGLLTAVLLRSECRAWVLDPKALRLPIPSATFHGRDLFAPVAARLAAGALALADCGPALDPAGAVRLDFPVPVPHPGGEVELAVLAADHFGNAALNLRAEDLPPGGTAAFYSGTRELGSLRRTYADVPTGHPVVYVNSFGRIEVAINGGSAARELGLRPGATVIMNPTGHAT